MAMAHHQKHQLCFVNCKHRLNHLLGPISSWPKPDRSQKNSNAHSYVNTGSYSMIQLSASAMIPTHL